MPLTFNSKTYTADQFGVDVVGYKGAAATLSVRDDLGVSRVPAKPTTTFSGVGRTQAKLTRTLTLNGALTPTGLAIITVGLSVPVGAAGADVDALCTDFGALVSHADFKLIAKNLKISF